MLDVVRTERADFFKISDFVLTTFQRIEGGEATGDPKVIDKVRHMFFRI